MFYKPQKIFFTQLYYLYFAGGKRMDGLYYFTLKKTKGKKVNMYDELIKELELHPQNNCSIKEAEELADKVIELSGFKNSLGSTPIIKIVKDFGFSAYKEKNLPKNISGNIFIGGTTTQIYHNDKVMIVGAEEEYYHQRFIIAHELAHYLMDYVGNEEYKSKEKLFSMAYWKNDHDNDEVRADRFATEILMPSKLFTSKYKRVFDLSFQDMTYTLNYLSDYFQTKVSCIKRRINELKLNDYGCDL